VGCQNTKPVKTTVQKEELKPCYETKSRSTPNFKLGYINVINYRCSKSGDFPVSIRNKKAD